MPKITINEDRHLLSAENKIWLPGKPDFVFCRQKVAIFVDGDFWHGNPNSFRIPKTNQAYWSAKIERNRARDVEATAELEALGWTVFRIWESSLRDEEA